MTDLPTNERTALILNCGTELPQWFSAWVTRQGLELVHVLQNAELVDASAAPVSGTLHALVMRSRPRMIVISATNADASSALVACERVKRDSFTAIVPLAVITDADALSAALAAGADEVITRSASADEAVARLDAMLRRSDRDLDVHPSTRLPGTREIALELERRIARREKFAVCYADLDHFKEYNDRYSYYRGNQVIQLLARLLHDVVKGLCAEEGFVGHIGGDDFLYMVPIAAMPRVSDEIVHVFDELMPLQYSEQDRRVGYFFGKDRRGQLHRVPLMTLSIGVVTNQRRRFTKAAEVSELATEMKSYAKTLPGSLWVVDRRRDDEAGAASVGPLAREKSGDKKSDTSPRKSSNRTLKSGGAR